MNLEAGTAAFTRRKRRSAAIAIAFLLSLLAVVTVHQWRVRADGGAHAPLQPPRSSLSLTSSSFANNGAIPRRFTCDGDGLSPSLQWSAAPAGTKSFALVVHDPDAQVDFTHWLVYDIPPQVRGLAQGTSTDGDGDGNGNGAMPRGSKEGINDFRSAGYAGPCPPPGKPHHYVFRLDALDGYITLPSGAKREELEAAMRGHILAEGQLVGIYQRPLFQ